MSQPHPCLSCGACCASFRVDFSVYESEENGGRVPRGLIDTVTDFTCRMRGTDYARPRCAALTGTVGEKAACGIYEWRPSPCRELPQALTPATAYACATAYLRWRAACCKTVSSARLHRFGPQTRKVLMAGARYCGHLPIPTRRLPCSHC